LNGVLKISFQTDSILSARNFRDFVSAETNFPVPVATEIRQRRERESRFFSYSSRFRRPQVKLALATE
jgi:hypothetical protein